MASELNALLLGLDQAFPIYHLIEESDARDVELHGYVFNDTVLDIISKDVQTSERRLQIDFSAMQTSNGNGELTTQTWIEAERNARDDVT